MTADPKPARRVRDKDLLRLMHGDRMKHCALTGDTEPLELHHILPRAQRGDDSRANLVWLRQDIHWRVTANDPVTLKLLGEHVWERRPDTVNYLCGKLGEPQAFEWMRRRLLIGAQ